MPKKGRGTYTNAARDRSRSRSGTPEPNIIPADPPLLISAEAEVSQQELSLNLQDIENIFPHPIFPFIAVANALQYAIVARKHAQNANVIHRIEIVFARFVQQLAQGEPPAFEYELRGSKWTDFELAENGALRVKADKTRWLLLSMGVGDHTSKFTRVVELLGRIKILLLTEAYSTKRELYYENKALHDFDQRNTDQAIAIVGLLLKVPRSHLNVLASNKGLVAGHLRFMNGDGIEVDCMHGFSGVNIPQHLGKLYFSHCAARMIFVIEKDASFQKFLSSGICHRFPCILVTGKGYPDLITREFVFRLSSLNIPVFAITDGDPHGFEIMCVYRFGCKAAHYDNTCFAVPEIKWLGILPSDIDLIKIPDYHLTPMTERNRQLVLTIQARPYCTEAFRQELDRMLERNRVAEIEGVTTFLQDNFLLLYLENKLNNFHWL